jgi:hypothetical protein
MPNNNTNLQRTAAFYHSLGKVQTESNNLISNELYKSAHNVRSNEVWMDIIPFAPTYASASSYSDDTIISMIGSTSSPAYLYPLTQTNYQTWFLDTGTPSVTIDGFIPSDNWCRPLISPSDVSDNKGTPSFGYSVEMYRRNGTTQISYNNAFFEIDYYAGLFRFDEGRTPKDTNNGLGFVFDTDTFESTPNNLKSAYIQNSSTSGPRIIAFMYVGRMLSDISFGGGGSEPIYQLGMTTSIPDGETDITLTNTPSRFSRIEVYVNGQVQKVGNGDINTDCYFGLLNTPKTIETIEIGDLLIWNADVAGFNLSPNDEISIVYEADI